MAAWRMHALIAATAALGSLLAWSLQGSPAAQSVGAPPSSIEHVGTLPDLLRESSGIAVSQTTPGVLWSHNDSGHRPIIYAIDLTGRVLAEFRVAGATNRDWEDIAAGPCHKLFPGEVSCLFIGDLGDNDGRRNTVRIYVVPEPRIKGESGGRAADSTVTARHIEIQYAEGRPDVEALAALEDGSLILVSKGRRGRSIVYRVPGPDPDTGIHIPLPVDTLDFSPLGALGRMVTGAAASPNGKILFVRTYSEIYQYDIGPSWTLALRGAPCFLGAIEPLGEAIDVLPGGDLVLTSEALMQRPGQINRVVCP